MASAALVGKSHDPDLVSNLRTGLKHLRDNVAELEVENDNPAWTLLVKYLPMICSDTSTAAVQTFNRDDTVVLRAPNPGRLRCVWQGVAFTATLSREESREVCRLHGAAVETIESFLSHARHLESTLKEETSDELVHCKVLRGGRWQIAARSKKRPLASFIALHGEAERLVEDCRAFLRTESEYARYGMPFKHNVLLVGPPGSGKSSLIMVLASELDFDVAFLTISADLTEREICGAIGLLTDKSILVLEDVDNICSAAQAGSQAAQASLAVLTSVLDGVLHRHGLITCLTSASPAALDNVLVREGRVDYTCRLEPPSRELVAAMATSLRPAGERSEDPTAYDAWFERVWSHIESRGGGLSNTVVMQFLFRHRQRALADFESVYRELTLDTRQEHIESAAAGMYF